MKFLSFLKRKAVYIPLTGVIIVVGFFVIYKIANKPDYQTAQVERREFVDEVSVTGKVVAANDVVLAFESGGRVTSIPATVGMKVTKGKALAYVNSGDLYASLLDQQARLESAQAQLSEVERGTRPTELQNIKEDVEQAKADLVLAIRDAFLTADDVLRSKIDVVFTNPTSAYPDMVSFGRGSDGQDLEDERVEVGNMMKKWKKSLALLSEDSYSDQYLLEAETNLRVMQVFLSELAIASSYFEDSTSLTETEQEAYIASISSGRTSINSEISSLNTTSQAYETAQNSLDLSLEGSTPEELQRARAAVKSAQANVLQAQSALSRTTITAPFDGVVTKIDLSVGEQASSGEPAISMISDANFEVESFIPEADIAQVEIGDMGTTTLDAYGDDVAFGVVVTAIDLSETEVDGVSTYKTTLQFVATDSRIRSGMTANIDLVSETRPGVLSIPQSAVTSKGGKRSVLVKNAEGKKEIRDVRTGGRDNSGNIEILSGLEEGETILWLSSK